MIPFKFKDGSITTFVRSKTALTHAQLQKQFGLERTDTRDLMEMLAESGIVEGGRLGNKGVEVVVPPKQY